MDRELVLAGGSLIVRCLKTNQELTCPSLSLAVDYLLGLKSFPIPADRVSMAADRLTELG